MPEAKELLAIYLNDHLMGATGGVELARRIVASQPDGEAKEQLRRIADEIAEDRAALVMIMRRLGIRADRLRVALGWVGEKAGRLKFNGTLLSRSPLSSVLELEAMRLGVEGKAAGWRTLQAISMHDGRLDTEHLDHLIARATEQIDTLERLRIAAAEVLVPTSRKVAAPQQERATGEQQSEEIAGQTVRKNPARAGKSRTASRASIEQAPAEKPSDKQLGSDGGRTKAQLYDEARQRNIEGRSRMTKEELERALSR